jgi:hypothetical protein
MSSIDSKDKLNLTAAAIKARSRIQVWLIFNLVLTFFLIVGQLLILGSMQQIYNRMIAIQAEYAEYYSAIKESVEERKSDERKEPNHRKQGSTK